MRNSPDEMGAAQRARWLAELSDALEHAQRLVWSVSTDPADAAARELWSRLEGARMEIRALQTGRRNRAPLEEGPDWINQSLWDQQSETG